MLVSPCLCQIREMNITAMTPFSCILTVINRLTKDTMLEEAFHQEHLRLNGTTHQPEFASIQKRRRIYDVSLFRGTYFCRLQQIIPFLLYIYIGSDDIIQNHFDGLHLLRQSTMIRNRQRTFSAIISLNHSLSKEKSTCFHKCFLAPQVGLEPTTTRLTAECSAIELLRNIGKRSFCSAILMESGGDLLSRAVSSQVSSALKSLTSVFGMGTGGTSSPLPPEIISFQGVFRQYLDNCTV